MLQSRALSRRTWNREFPDLHYSRQPHSGARDGKGWWIDSALFTILFTVPFPSIPHPLGTKQQRLCTAWKICADAGTTRLACKIAGKQGRTYFIFGSSHDSFEDYASEPIICEAWRLHPQTIFGGPKVGRAAQLDWRIAATVMVQSGTIGSVLVCVILRCGWSLSCPEKPRKLLSAAD